MKKDVFRGIIDGERWEVVFDGYYAVSSMGRIMRTASGSSKAAVPGKIISPGINLKKYRFFMVNIDKVRRAFTVHKVVSATFIGIRPHGMQVNHKDGNKANNCVSNLEYVTGIENQQHSWNTGIRSYKVPESIMAMIMFDLNSGIETRDVAAKYNISNSYAKNLRQRGGRRTSQSSPLDELIS